MAQIELKVKTASGHSMRGLFQVKQCTFVESSTVNSSNQRLVSVYVNGFGSFDTYNTFDEVKKLIDEAVPRGTTKVNVSNTESASELLEWYERNKQPIEYVCARCGVDAEFAKQNGCPTAPCPMIPVRVDAKPVGK